MPHAFGLWRRYDVERAAKRLQDLERLADLCGRLSGFEIDDEAQADARRAGEFILPQARSFAGGADDVADLGRCQGSSRT